METLRLSLDVTSLSKDSAHQAIDQLMEAGIPPLPDGHCAMRGCSGTIRRRTYSQGEDRPYCLSPYCPVCGKRYRQTPHELWLPLETTT